MSRRDSRRNGWWEQPLSGFKEELNAAGGRDQGPGDEKGRQDGGAWVLRDDDESRFEHGTSLRLSPLCVSKYQVH